MIGKKVYFIYSFITFNFLTLQPYFCTYMIDFIFRALQIIYYMYQKNSIFFSE